VDRLIANTNFRDGCGEGFLLRNLVALGYAEHPDVKKELIVLRLKVLSAIFSVVMYHTVTMTQPAL